jgi:hypothetical protein
VTLRRISTALLGAAVLLVAAAAQPGSVARAIVGDPCLNIGATANDDAYAATEDHELTVPAPGYLANDTCADGVTGVQVSGLGAGMSRVVILNDGSLTVDFNKDFVGASTIVYAFTGTYGTSNQATISVNVAAVDDPPNLTGSCGPFTDIGEDEGPQKLNCFGAVPGGGPDECPQTLTGHVGLDSISNVKMFASDPNFVVARVGSTCLWAGVLSITPANGVGGGSAVLDLWVSDNGDLTTGGIGSSKLLKVAVAVLVVAQPVSTPTPRPVTTPRVTVPPGPGTAQTPKASGSVEASPSSSIGPLPDATATAGAALVGPAGTASTPPGLGPTGSGSEATGPGWPVLIAVLLVVVVAANLGLYLVLRRRRPVRPGRLGARDDADGSEPAVR